MPVLEQIHYAFGRFMNERNGADYLGLTTLCGALLLCLLGIFTGWAFFTVLCALLYVWALFRMLSKNIYARLAENRAFMKWWMHTKHSLTQYIKFLNSLKSYKYFSCPNCRTSMRMPRGLGVKRVVCSRCKHVFRQQS